MKHIRLLRILALLVAFMCLFSACGEAAPPTIELPPPPSDPGDNPGDNPDDPGDDIPLYTMDALPAYEGEMVIPIQKGEPNFTQEELTTQSYEFYSPLDSLGRCGYAMASVGRDLMPEGGRGNINSIKPTGWTTYDDGGAFYERAHLIAWSLTGEDANRQNLITGTHNMNSEMISWEESILNYVKTTGNHVMYRVTPLFQGDNLLATGVHMEAYSVEDEGEGISFNIFIYNAQNGVDIDYATGAFTILENDDIANATFVYSKAGLGSGKTVKFHLPDCRNVQSIKEENRVYCTETYQEMIDQGFVPAGCCNPGDTSGIDMLQDTILCTVILPHQWQLV